MAPASSAIEWTDATWNPTTGCTKVSPGCAHCYAETLTKRYAGSKGWPEVFEPWIPGNNTVFLHPSRLNDPLKWKTPRRVFVNSMSDLFHEDIPMSFLSEVWDVMSKTPQHQYQILTKRPDIMRRRLNEKGHGLVWAFGVLPNVWLGVTVENQRWADERIPILLDTPAAVRFVSAEPLLGPLEFFHDTEVGVLTWLKRYEMKRGHPIDSERLDWVIVGGESGPHHRPFNPDWARKIVAECYITSVACFVKQLGGARPGTNLEDLPEDLRVREYPV